LGETAPKDSPANAPGFRMSEVNMDRQRILDILTKAAGDPTNGAVKDVLPDLADALDAALNPITKRVTTPPETR